MYKSKLQEYCQSQAWNLPVYSIKKEGFDHSPQFEACVVVNGSTFSTPNPFKSSKEAQNFAAKLAFDALMGSSNAGPSSPCVPVCDNVEPPTTNETTGGLNSLSRSCKNSKDVGHFYKSKLHTYALKRNLVLPSYTTKREGPPHLCRFKSKVTFDGITYESPEYFSTIKDAENAAAKVALVATSLDENEEEDRIFYKNLLQELAQKQFSCLPKYSTLSFGSGNSSRFISMVEVKSESFTGQEVKTKKLAELDAAKVAYIALKEGLQKQNSRSHPPGSHVKDPPLHSSPKQQQTISESCETSTEQGANQKANESEPYVVGAEVRAKSANLCGVLNQTPSRSVVGSNTDEPDRSDPLQSNKRLKVEPTQDPITIFPPGTVIMRSGGKWVALTDFDSIEDND